MKQYLSQIVGCLMAENAKDVSDAELHRCLDGCAGAFIPGLAINLREIGILTNDAISNPPKPHTVDVCVCGKQSGSVRFNSFLEAAEFAIDRTKRFVKLGCSYSVRVSA